jgi:hypothetical protein
MAPLAEFLETPLMTVKYRGRQIILMGSAMPGDKESVKGKARGRKQPDESGKGHPEDLAYGRSGPGGAQESRAENTATPPGDSEEVLGQSQRGQAFAAGPGLPEKPIDVGAEPYDMEKTGGVPGGMSGMENEGNVGVHRGSAEYPPLSPDVKDFLGAKKGRVRKRNKK